MNPFPTAVISQDIVHLSQPKHTSLMDILQGNWENGGAPILEFVSHPLSRNVFFLGGGWGRRSLPPYSMCSLSRKNIFSSIFHNNLNTCFVYTLPMELECTIYYLSPNAYSFIVSPHFLHAEYENPCLIT